MFDIEILKEQNPWWIARSKIDEDVHLERLKAVRYVWYPDLIGEFELSRDVIYTLRGGRQVGKTTTLKILIKKLLREISPENIFYFTCNNLDNYQQLLETITGYLDWVENGRRKYIFVDEITFVDSWTRAIKHLADLGRLKNCFLLLTGSNARDLKYEAERMPGRRGRVADLDKILFPLSFREYLTLANPKLADRFLNLTAAKRNYPFYRKELNRYLDNFLLSGGFIQAINSLAQDRKISMDIYQQYLSWVLGDLVRAGKKEAFARQIFQEVINTLTTSIGFDTIAHKTSIGSHLTVGDYLEVMECNFILKVLYQLDIDKKIPAYRRGKKIYFQDLFLFWVFLGYVWGASDYFSMAKRRLGVLQLKERLVENLVMSSLLRRENVVNWSNIVFFFRSANQKEVDFLVRTNYRRCLPIEVKYGGRVRERYFSDLEKINSDRAIIVSRQDFRVGRKRIIVPLEVFLLVQDKLLGKWMS